jgi:hypothetical protein
MSGRLKPYRVHRGEALYGSAGKGTLLERVPLGVTTRIVFGVGRDPKNPPLFYALPNGRIE